MKIYDMEKNGKWFMRDTTKEEDAYFVAWHKVREWVKANVHFDEPFEFRVDDPSGFSDVVFCVEGGNACIKKGAYGHDCFVDHHESADKSSKSNFYADDAESVLSRITMKMIRQTIDRWPMIKNALMDRIRQRNNVFHFEA